MTTVLLAIDDGCEEIEAVTCIDVLRRAGVEVCVASAKNDSLQITASRGVKIVADQGLLECVDHTWDMIVLPGGMPGAKNLSENAALITRLKRQLDQGKWVAAICAAPAVILGEHQLIEGATATCYPSFQNDFKDKIERLSQNSVVVDGNLITSQGPGTAMAFALKLVSVLMDQKKADEVAKALLF